MTKIERSSLRDEAIKRVRLRMRYESFTNIKLSDIARDLHVSHAALYKYFSNKQDLFDAVNIQWMDDINTQLQTICLSDNPASVRITQWFIELYSLHREKALNEGGAYLSYINTEQLERPCAQEDAIERKRQLVALVTDAMAAEEFRQQDPEKVAVLLFDATDHFTHPAFIIGHAKNDMTASLAELLNVLLAGLSVDLTVKTKQ